MDYVYVDIILDVLGHFLVWILLFLFLLFLFRVILLRWVFRIDTIIRRLTKIIQNLEELNNLNQTLKDIRILLNSIDKNINESKFQKIGAKFE